MNFGFRHSTAGPSSEIERDQLPKGVVRVPSSGNVARSCSLSPSDSSSVSSHDSKVLLQGDSANVDLSCQTARAAATASSDYRFEQHSVIETRNAAVKEVDTDDEYVSDHSEVVNRFVMLMVPSFLAHWLVLGCEKYSRWKESMTNMIVGMAVFAMLHISNSMMCKKSQSVCRLKQRSG